MSNNRRFYLISALLLFIGMLITVGTALGFQHIGGYIPCKLCLEQRLPYYIGAPLMAATAIMVLAGAPSWSVRIFLAAAGLLMSWGLVLAVYHSGVEWHWWAGPADCGAVDATPSAGGEGVLDMLDKFVPPSCDEAAGRFLGLSFAGWNVLASLILASYAFYAAVARSYGSSSTSQ